MSHPDEIQVTREELQNEAEALARQVLNTSGNDAWRRIRAGELEGTLFASRMARLRALLGEGDPGHLPAAAE